MENGESDASALSFADPLYLKAAVLDPTFGTMWLAHDVSTPESIKDAESTMIKAMFVILFNFNITKIGL